MSPTPTLRIGGLTPGLIYSIYVVGFAIFVAVLTVLEFIGVPDKIIGYLFIFFTITVYAGIGYLARTDVVSEYYVAGRRIPAMYNGMATAADWMSAASFLGMAGTLYALGHDGLAFVIGWTGGFVLVAVLIAPYLRRAGAFTIPDFLVARFGGGGVRIMSLVVLFVCSFTYIVAQITGTGVIASRFLGIDFEIAVFAALFGILVCSMLGGMRAVTWTQVAQYIILVVAYLLPVVILSWQKTGNPIPPLAYGQVLQDIAALEANMRFLEGVTPHASPFAHMTQVEFVALILCLTLGTAALPHVLMRYLTTTSVRATRISVAWTLLFVALLYVTAPAYAAFAKLEIYGSVLGSDVSTLQAVRALPEWIFRYGQIGMVEICGAAPGSAEALYAACLRDGGGDILTFSRFAIDPDVVVIAMPEIAGLPFVIAGLVAAGGLAAALSTADGLLLAIANGLSHDIYFRMVDPKASAKRRLSVARLLLMLVALCAALVAGSRPAGILAMVAWAFSLAAAGLFPALVVGIWWRRATSRGVVAGMASGFTVTLSYMIATAWFDMPLWFGIDHIASGVFGLPVAFATIFIVSRLDPAPPAEAIVFVEALRDPTTRIGALRMRTDGLSTSEHTTSQDPTASGPTVQRGPERQPDTVFTSSGAP